MHTHTHNPPSLGGNRNWGRIRKSKHPTGAYSGISLLEDGKISPEHIPTSWDSNSAIHIRDSKDSVTHKHLSPRQLDFLFESSAPNIVSSELLDGWTHESISGHYHCLIFLKLHTQYLTYSALFLVHLKSKMSSKVRLSEVGNLSVGFGWIFQKAHLGVNLEVLVVNWR